MLWRGGARGSGGAPKQVARRGEAEEGAADRGSKFDCALLEEGAAPRPGDVAQVACVFKSALQTSPIGEPFLLMSAADAEAA